MSEKKETKVFKLWHCPNCGESFNHWVTKTEEEQKYFLCPNCYSEVPSQRKKMV